MLTRNQRRFIERYPHLESRVRGLGTGTPTRVAATPTPRRVALPVCEHRGPLIDTTSCRCKVYTCRVHGTCSTSSRAGLTLCPCDKYLEGDTNASR